MWWRHNIAAYELFFRYPSLSCRCYVDMDTIKNTQFVGRVMNNETNKLDYSYRVSHRFTSDMNFERWKLHTIPIRLKCSFKYFHHIVFRVSGFYLFDSFPFRVLYSMLGVVYLCIRYFELIYVYVSEQKRTRSYLFRYILVLAEAYARLIGSARSRVSIIAISNCLHENRLVHFHRSCYIQYSCSSSFTSCWTACQ